MVRKLLRIAEPKRFSIADAANRWGFWHMGQFTADYRELFGELPSKTLRNSYETKNGGLVRGRYSSFRKVVAASGSREQWNTDSGTSTAATNQRQTLQCPRHHRLSAISRAKK